MSSRQPGSPLIFVLLGASALVLALTASACETSGPAPEPTETATSPATAEPSAGTGEPSASAEDEARRRLRTRLGGRRQVLAERGDALERRRAVRESRSREQSLTEEQRVAIEVIRQNSHPLHRCYLDSLSEAGEIRSADLRLRIDIDPTGRAVAVEALENDLPETSIASCLTEQIQAMGFPATRAGVQVVYPLHFGPRQP